MNYLTFEQCFEAAAQVAQKVECCSGSYHAVYGIPQGGMIPAAMVAYHLRLPLTDRLFLTSDSPDKGVLVVDDTINTGKALKSVRAEKHDLAVLQIHEKNLSKCRYYGIIINDFVEFPWEKKEWGFLEK